MKVRIDNRRPLGSGPTRPHLPEVRGPLTEYLTEHLRRPPHQLWPHVFSPEDPLTSDDRQMALYVCYELFYRSFEGVDDGWEWEPSLLALRRSLEIPFEQRLIEDAGWWFPDNIATELLRIVETDDGPSVSRYFNERGTEEQFREFVVHRSAYQQKEADPHTWAVPRLSGIPKAALVGIQFEEYGEGNARNAHSAKFLNTMCALGLDNEYGSYLNIIPGVTLATVNLISLFGLHRRWRGALAGHLTLFEMTSTGPNRRYGDALRRLGFGSAATDFYDIHVEADADHELMALHHLAGGLAAQEPAIAGDILFGARALALLESAWSDHLLRAWSTGRTSLLKRIPLP